MYHGTGEPGPLHVLMTAATESSAIALEILATSVAAEQNYSL